MGATCIHECICGCHTQVTRTPPPYISGIEKKYLIEVPRIAHAIPCCDGTCRLCAKYIRTGTMSDHLRECHQIADPAA